MKKINLRGLQEKLSAKELKNVMGGSTLPGLGCKENAEMYECSKPCVTYSGAGTCTYH